MDLRDRPLERFEHPRRVLAREARENEMQRAPVVEAVLDEARDLPRRRGIVPAVEPHLAIADERPRREMLQPRRPVGPAHRRAQRRSRHSQRVLMAEHRDRERGIHRLMPAGQPRQRQVQLARLVAIADLALPRDRIPRAAARQPDRAALARNLVDLARRPRADKAA